jgi:hypothetical protein
MTRARLPLAALLGVASLGFVGCKISDDVVVKADGSGAFTESTTIDVEAMTQLREAMKAFGPPRGRGPGMDGGDKPPEPTTPTPTEPGSPPAPDAKPAGPVPVPTDPLERMKARWKDIPGLEVTKATSETKDGKQTVEVEATFKTLEAYAQASGLPMGSTLVKNEDGSYTLTFDLRLGGRGGRPDGERRHGPGMGEGQPGGMEDGGMEGGGMEPTPPGMEGGDSPRGPGGGMGGMGGMGAMMLPLFEKYMAGTELTRKLKLPGTIVETNGTKSEDGTTVTWKITADDLKAGMTGGKFEPQTVTFKGEGLDLKPFTAKRSARREFMGGGPGGPGAPGGPVSPGGPGAPGGDGK